MRSLGAAFNPDTVCEYTGLALYMHPTLGPAGWSMGFWRADGYLRAVDRCTPDEIAWLWANPAAYQQEHAQFMQWRASLTPQTS